MAYTRQNINLLSEEEWRRIHNALSVYRTQTRRKGLIKLGDEIQQLMDKVRNHYIPPST